ncbi:MAG: sugar phosphate isomerase/epimerase family protein [Spirochaetota bacterium]
MLETHWNPTIAVSTACFDGYSLEKTLEELAGSAVPSVELAYIDGYVSNFSEALFDDAKAKTVRGMMDAAGTECTAVSAHTDLSTGDALERVRRRIRFTAAIGADRVVTNAAIIENEVTFLKNLETLAREAESAGVDLLLENPGDGRQNVVNDGATAAALFERLDLPRVSINYDFGNVVSHFYEKVRPEEDWKPIRRIAGYFHLKDVAKEGENYCYPELGTGVIDYPSILAGIREDKRVPALGLEIPLRLRRRPDASPYRIDEPLSVPEIRGIVERSLRFLMRELGF